MIEKMNPSKRLKNWHRKLSPQISLRAYGVYLRKCAILDSADPATVEMAKLARAWILNKRGAAL